MAFDIIAELESLVDVLNRERIEYAVCGALALAVHGRPRATKDIDLLVRPEDVATIRDVVREVGFDIPARTMTFRAGTATPRTIDRISKLDEQDGQLLVLDLIHVGIELEGVWSTRQRVQLPGREMPVVSRDGLVIMKKIAGRPQDLVDVSGLEGTDDPDA